MKENSQERFDELQAKYRAAHEAYWNFHRSLKSKYGETWRAPSSMEKKLKSAENREYKSWQAVMVWLERFSPRQWTGIPVHWICSSLTYADATTTGQMAVIPPPAYGYSPDDSIRFARPVAA